MGPLIQTEADRDIWQVRLNKYPGPYIFVKSPTWSLYFGLSRNRDWAPGSCKSQGISRIPEGCILAVRYDSGGGCGVWGGGTREAAQRCRTRAMPGEAGTCRRTGERGAEEQASFTETGK